MRHTHAAAVQGAKAWLTLYGAGPVENGEYKNPGGVYECEIAKLTDMTINKESVPAVQVQVLDGPLAGETVGPFPANGSKTEGCLEWGGDGEGSVNQMDEDFPEAGFDDMTEMRMLSDAELNRNLKIFHQVRGTCSTHTQSDPWRQADRCYCMCGPTLVAVNLFKGVGAPHDMLLLL